MTETAHNVSDQKFINSRNVQFPIDPNIISRKIRRLLRLELYEDRETHAALRAVKSSDIILELGTGIGYMSAVIGKNVQPKEIHTFEANPLLIEYAKNLHDINDIQNCHVTNAIIGEQSGTTTFYARTDILTSSLDKAPRGIRTENQTEHKIPVLAARSVFKEIRPTVFICDIEGAESWLIPLCDFTTVKVAILELHPQWIGKDGVQAVFDKFHQSGLTFFPKLSSKKVVVFRRDW